MDHNVLAKFKSQTFLRMTYGIQGSHDLLPGRMNLENNVLKKLGAKYFLEIIFGHNVYNIFRLSVFIGNYF